MPSIEENKKLFSNNYDWSSFGDEWSTAWGTATHQWFCSIYPRIMNYLKGGHILEIAPGYGRWTAFLLNHCEELSIVDLNVDCINGCKSRFNNINNINYFVNDGKSLDMIKDNSIDFVFSFDSLVHAEEDVLKAYVENLSNKLKPGAFGFIHHSNLGLYDEPPVLDTLTLMNEKSLRAKSMSFHKFRQFCENTELACITQELLPWGQDIYIDCLSTFTKKSKDSPKIRTALFYNQNFTEEQKVAKNINKYYPKELCKKSLHIDIAKTQHKIDELKQKYPNKKICFYGAGKLAIEFIENLDLTGVDIISFIDNDLTGPRYSDRNIS